jgi:hypothetical protein
VSWIVSGDGDSRLILNGDRVAGSVVRRDDNAAGWHVEVLWSGPTGDITYDAPTMLAATAFIQGVEKALEAIGFNQQT